MASYKLDFKPSAEKDLRRLPQAILSRIFQKLEILSKDPFPPQSIKLTNVDQLSRVRVGDYRIIYEVLNDEGRILVYYIRHRREAYRSL